MNSLQIVLLVALASVIVEHSESLLGSEMQVVLGEMGVELPPMPPSMPQSLKEHLYPQERQRKQMRLQQQQRQREAIIRTLKHQRQQQLLLLQQHAASQPKNPYSVHYSNSISANSPESVNLVNSAANAIPGSGPNAVGPKAPVNPYSVSRLGSSIGATKNPYLTMRTLAPVGVPRIRPAAVISTMKMLRDQPKRVREATAAGCKTPFENPAASAMFMGNCNSRNAKMVCQSMMMSCANIGMTAMCCPIGVNKMVIDTMNYMQKMQKYVADMM